MTALPRQSHDLLSCRMRCAPHAVIRISINITSNTPALDSLRCFKGSRPQAAGEASKEHQASFIIRLGLQAEAYANILGLLQTKSCGLQTVTSKAMAAVESFCICIDIQSLGVRCHTLWKYFICFPICIHACPEYCAMAVLFWVTNGFLLETCDCLT